MNLHYQTEGRGPVVICLHGGKGNSGDYFFPFLSPLAKDLTMVYLDERGSGKSKPVPDKTRVSHDGFAEDIENLVRHLGVDQVGVLGHSYGGYLALYFTLKYPHRVRELYVVAGGAAYPQLQAQWWPEVFKKEMDRLNVTASVQEVYDQYNTGKITADQSFREVVKRQAPSIFYHWPERKALILETLARTDFTYIGAENSNFTDTPDLTPRFSEIRCPTLLIAGQHDISMPIEVFGAMARMIPECELFVTPRARHYPFIDQPERVCERIRTFRREQRLGTAT
jgi:proline iminopeptidase